MGNIPFLYELDGKENLVASDALGCRPSRIGARLVLLDT